MNWNEVLHTPWYWSLAKNEVNQLNQEIMTKSEQIAALNERNKLKDSKIKELKDEIAMRVKERELANQKYIVA